MCTHSKYVTNKYLGRSILVSCGKCNSCLQEKANARALRIRNHNGSSNDLCLFLTLTYDNKFVPYVDRDTLKKCLTGYDCRDIPIYRDYDFRYYKNVQHVYNETKVVGRIDCSDLHKPAYYCPPLNKKPQGTGVILWSDVQRFMKRLRTNLKRLYNYEEKITYFAVGEYGSSKKSWRPHFHLLVYFPKGSYEALRPVIVKSWPYGDMLRSDKRIQVALDASGYVASYVNKSVDLPSVLKTSSIRQKHSHSQGFGVRSHAFSLNSLLSKVGTGDFSYTREVLVDGKPVLAHLPVPQYVVNRYFPKFKGYSSFAPAEIRGILQRPIELWDKLGQSPAKLIASEYIYTKEDYRKFIVRLDHCYQRYYATTGRSYYDYANDYLAVWNARDSYVLKHSYDDYDVTNFYENLCDLYLYPSMSPTLSVDSRFQFNPNLRKDLVLKDYRLSDLKQKKDNQRSLSSEILSRLYDDM